jgi:hypothetical protein
VRADLVHQIKESYPDTLAPDVAPKDSSRLFSLLWQEWIELASALEPDANSEEKPGKDSPPAAPTSKPGKLSIRMAVSVKTEAQLQTSESKAEQQEQVILAPDPDAAEVAEEAEVAAPDHKQRSLASPSERAQGFLATAPLGRMHLDLDQINLAAAAGQATDRMAARPCLSHRLADPALCKASLESREALQAVVSARLPLLTPRQYELVQFQVGGTCGEARGCKPATRALLGPACRVADLGARVLAEEADAGAQGGARTGRGSWCARGAIPSRRLGHVQGSARAVQLKPRRQPAARPSRLAQRR